MTALQVMLELLPPSHWDSQWWICLGHVSCMDAVGRVGSHWHCLTLVVVSGLAQLHHLMKSVYKTSLLCLLDVVPRGWGCVKVSGTCAASCSVAVTDLWIPTSHVASVVGLVILEQQLHWCSLGLSGLIKNSHSILALYKSGRLNY